MLCQSCHKKEATVHLTQIAGEQIAKLNLCEECAKLHGIEVQTPLLPDLLAGLGRAADAPSAGDLPVCPLCGGRPDDIKKSGRVGCAQCYTSFPDEMLTIIRSIHHAGQHMGKTPSRLPVVPPPPPTPSPAPIAPATPVKPSPAALREQLQRQIEKAIATEQYEEAARLRDEIRAMDSGPEATANA